MKKMSIYSFLGNNKEVLYIGKTIDLHSRIKTHSHLPVECYQQIREVRFLIATGETDLDLLEAFYINELKPKFNQIIPKKHDENTIEIIPIDMWETLDIDINYMNNKTSISDKLELRITFKESESNLYEYIKLKSSPSAFLKDLAKLEKKREDLYLNKHLANKKGSK